MLRLRTSEITLTLADIEETRRRMERKKAASPPDALSVTVGGTSGPTGHRPRLRRGPQRPYVDALTALGPIPILIPQQAVVASLNDPDDSSPHSSDSLLEDERPVTDALMLSHGEPGSPRRGVASTDLLAPSPLDSLQPPHGPALGAAEEASGPAATSEEWPDTPAKQLLTPPRFGREGVESSEDGNETASRSRLSSSTDGQVEVVESRTTLTRPRMHSLRQHSSHAPSPLHKMYTVSSPSQPGCEKSSEQGLGLDSGVVSEVFDPDEEESQDDLPRRYLQGYWDQYGHYTFREHRPRTEPRPRTRRAHLARTMSASSDPFDSAQIQRLRQLADAGEDVFWTGPSTREPVVCPAIETGANTEPSSDRYWSPLSSTGAGSLRAAGHTSQRHSSAASSTSLPYSFYELPQSRHSGSSQSQDGFLGQSQYDGTASSRRASRGTYHSIRPSQIRRPSALQSLAGQPLNVPLAGQYALSPLPAVPYTRIPSAQNPRPWTSIVSPDDFGIQDAARAAERDLPSPLDLIQERGTSFLAQSAVGHRATAPGPYAALLTGFRPRGRNLDSFFAGGSTQDSEGSRQDSVNSTDGPVSQASPRQITPVVQHIAPIPDPASTQRMAHYVRREDTLAARVEQRSSENVPVGGSPQEQRPSRRIQGQGQRISLGPRPNPPSPGPGRRGGDYSLPLAPPRFSVPHGSAPRDVSNRIPPRARYQGSATPRSTAQDNIRQDGSLERGARSPRPGFGRALPFHSSRGPPVPPRYASRQHDGEALAPRLPRRPVPPPPLQHTDRQETAPLPFNRRPERGTASTSTTFDLASGITSRRSAVNRAAAASRRRIPQQQHNQENSGEAERAAMRQELAAVGMRYGEEARLDVMDETPPRIGRFERHMLD